MKKNQIKIFIQFAVFLAFILSPLHAIAQKDKGEISGRIVDKNAEAVPYVAVAIKGTTIGQYANDKGEFKISAVSSGNHTLSVSGVGIETKEIAISIAAGKITNLGDIIVENSVNLGEVAIIGKSRARQQQEQAYAITVLDVKNLYTSLPSINKALNTVTSVRVREDGGLGSNFNFSLNGFSGNQVKFFLDGIPMDNFGSSFNLSNISVNMAERVDIYKGVLPVNLGADALGGAVNIVSRKDANYLDAAYSIGSFNTHRASVNGAFTDKTGFTLRANIFYNYSDNNYKVYAPIMDLSENKFVGNQWVKRFHDKYESGGIKFETGIVNKPFADYLLLGIIASKNDGDVQTGATMDAVYGGITYESQSMIPSIRYKKDDLFIEGLSLSFYGAYNHVKSYKTDTISRKYNWLGESVESGKIGERSAATESKITNKEWQTNINLSYMLDLHNSLTINHVYSSLDRKLFDKRDPNNESNQFPQNLTKNIIGLGWMATYERWNANLFIKNYNTDSYTYKKVDQFTENERFEKIQNDKTSIGYGGAFAYFILPSLQAKLSYEKTFRLPESYEMFGDGLYQTANADLKPENSSNANLGIMYEHILGQHTFMLETNFIYRDTRDFILKEVSATSNPTSGYKNIGKVLTKGIEGSLRYKWKQLLHASVSLTYQDIRDKQKFEEVDNSYVGEGNRIEHINYGYRLPNIPYLFGNGNVGLRFQNIGMKDSELSIDYMANFVAEYYLSLPGLGAVYNKDLIPEQFSHDASISYSIKKGKYNVALECTNFTDQKLYDNFFLQKPGRAFNVKFRYFLK